MLMRTGTILALVAMTLLVLPACEFIEQHPKAFAGAGLGMAGGAVLGGLAHGRKGAMVYGFLGALAGGAIGAYLDSQDKSAPETYQEYSYQAQEGVRIEVVDVSADPDTVAPGGQVQLRVTYAVMAPDPYQGLLVTENRLVTLNGVQAAENVIQIDRKPGTYTSTVPITLPPTATTGVYQLLVTLTVTGRSTQGAAHFTVD